MFVRPTSTVKLRSCLVKTMIDIGCKSHVSNEDFLIIICQTDANATADAAIVYLLSELEEMEAKSNAISERLRLSIVRRVKERRNEDVVWLAKFLVNPDTILKDDKISGRKPVKSTCINLANKLAKRLISRDNEKEEDEEAAAASDESQNLSKKQLLQRAMKDAKLEQPGSKVTRERTDIIVEAVNKAALSAKPISV